MTPSPSCSEPSPSWRPVASRSKRRSHSTNGASHSRRRCERLLADAELRVQQLVARAGGALEVRDVRPEEATEDLAAGT